MVRVYVKGAPEICIELCDKIIGEGGQTSDLTMDKKDEIVN